jgi:hypothetical protein
MEKIKIVRSMMLFALTSAAGAASAITGPAVVNFEQSGQAKYTGGANLAAPAPGSATCSTGTGQSGCYAQNGMVVGTVYDPTDNANHFHRNSDDHLDGGASGTGYTLSQLGAYSAGTFSDANGIYIRAADQSAFSMTSLIFNASFTPTDPATNPIYGANPYLDGNGILQPQGSTYDANGNFVPNPSVTPAANDQWEILGFSKALNPTLAQDTQGSSSAVNPVTGTTANLLPEVGGNGPVYSDLVATQYVANGFNGLLTLNSSFQNVSAIWIFKEGYPEAPTNGIAFRAYVDNLQFNSAVIPTTVPVPGAVWLFATGFAGLLSFGKRKGKI